MKHHIRKWLAASIAASLYSVAIAQFEHEPLRTSPGLDIDSVYQAALAVAPETPGNMPRQQMAQNYRALGERWIANRPSWEASYIDDGLLDDAGLREIEAGVRVDLWRPGERAQTAALGSSYQIKADAWQLHVGWLVAGRVRTVLADIAEAEAGVTLEREATGEAERLLEITTGLYQNGAVPELDVMQARTLLLAQREKQLQADAALVDAERNYGVLTNLNIRPALAHEEPLSTTQEISLAHPYLALLQSDVELAQADIAKAKREALGSPSMTLGVRRERGDFRQEYNDSFGVSFSMPFGGSAAVSARTGLAYANKVDHEIQFTKALQALRVELHEVEHELHLIDETLQLADERNQLSQRHWEMSQAAFEAGEITLVEVVLTLQQAQASRSKLVMLQLDQQRKITEYNQLVGEIP